MILLKRIFYLSLFILTFASIQPIVYSNPIELQADEEWLPPGTVVSGTNNGDTPVISRAPNGELMIVYNRWNGDTPAQTNGYYSISNNNGLSWSTPAVISATTNVRNFITVTYDHQSKAHAVWVEASPTPTPTKYSVLYASRPTGGSWSTPVVISSISNFVVPITHAEIIESQPNVLHILWDEPVSMKTDRSLWHIRSTNGGTSWGTPTRVVPASIEPERTPAVAADSLGNLHVVWEQQTIGGGFDVYYSRLTAGNTVWSARVNLSGGTLVGENAFQPDIEISRQYVNVAILYRLSTTNQIVYLRKCLITQPCTSTQQWSSLREIGQFVAVNASDPFNIIPKMVYSDKVLLNYYHGITNSTNNRELLWESSDCENWASSFLTPITARSINPTVTAHDFTVYLAYERVVEASPPSPTHQIYFMSGPVGCAKGNLPIIRR